MFKKMPFFVFAIILAIFILKNQALHAFINSLGDFEYIGSFIVGFFFVITFTVLPATAALLILADSLNPFLLAVTAGLGAMCADYIMYRFFRSESDKITGIKTFGNNQLRWLAVLVGALIIASPFPDELGIALLGITRLETKKFLLLSFVLNTAGILVIVGLGRIF